MSATLPARRFTTGQVKLATGIGGLDRLLDGGLVRGNSLLIEGPPGSGKSTLGLRIIHEGIVRHREPGLVIAFEEFPRQIYMEAASTGVDLRAHEEAGLLRVLWTPPSRILEGFRGKDDLVRRIVDELGVRRILIDSITHFKRVAGSELELREVLASLTCHLKLQGVSTFLVKELEDVRDERIAFEEYLVDASVRLYHDPAASGPADGSRLLEIRKTRGQDHVGGRHPFELGRDGFRVYPRTRPGDVDRLFPSQPVTRPMIASGRERVTTGEAELDDMLGGGFFPGSLNLVCGESGSGRSTLARQCLHAGLAEGCPALLVTMQEPADELVRKADRLGLDWGRLRGGGLLRILDFDPLAYSAERLQAEVLEAVGEQRPERMVFDGIDDMKASTQEPADITRHVAVLQRLARRAGVTVLATTSPGEPDHERLASGVLHLSMQVSEGHLRRHLLVTKLRGSAHATDLREVTLEETGLRVPARE